MRARKNKRSKNQVIVYERNLEYNLTLLLDKLKRGEYKVGNYKKFIIYEPKEREIQSLPYEDRIVQQWYVYEFVLPYILPKFINQTYACIKDRGTHKAVQKVQEYIRRASIIYPDCYILKCDIKKFFMSINPDILYDIMKRHITDKYILRLTKQLIYNDEIDLGIPIGNYTSQYFANIYLDVLDKFVKNVLKCKFYTRYMDDFILILENKAMAKDYKKKIEEFIDVNLKLELNHKSRYYPIRQRC